MIEHDMSFVNKVSDRILALNYGKILASGLPDKLKITQMLSKPIWVNS